MAKMPVTDVKLKAPLDTPVNSPLTSEPWDIAQGHANTQEEMGAPRGLGIVGTAHERAVNGHSVAAYASYVEEDVRNPEGSS